jgi:Lar family restriction alleviation protein
MTDQLKRCPFCGELPRHMEFVDYDRSAYLRFGVKCEGCNFGIEGPREDKTKTIERWNTRRCEEP